METRKKELSVLPVMVNHKGFDCKIYALAGVLKWLHTTKQIDTPPAPARKRDDKEYEGHSLRWYLKQEFNSTVGVVHNVIDLALTAEKQAEVAAYYAECKSEDEYFKTLTTAIDQGLAPIVFFDMGKDNLPTKLNGQMEHAAILVGYFFEKDVLFFRISQFGKYFDFNAKILYESTDQLPTMRLIQENYFKINRDGEGAWLPRTYVKDHFDSVIQRRREKNSAQCSGVRNKILILDSKNNPHVKTADMPVQFKRPASFNKTQGLFGIERLGVMCETVDTDEDKKLDEQINANLAKIKKPHK